MVAVRKSLHRTVPLQSSKTELNRLKLVWNNTSRDIHCSRYSVQTIQSGRADKFFNEILNGRAQRIILNSGSECEVNVSYTATEPFKHFVLIFPQDQGSPTPSEIIEMCGITMLIAKNLALRILGNEECYSISKNGSATGSVPNIEHFHIYLFASREEKINFYEQNILQARRANCA